MVVNLVISHIRTSLALLGILCPSGVCLVQNDTFTDVLSYKLGKIVVYGESVSGCVCVHVCACEHGSMCVYVHLQFYRIMPVFSCGHLKQYVFLSTQMCIIVFCYISHCLLMELVTS